MIRWFIFILVVAIADYYAFQSLRTITKSNWWFALYWIFTIAVLGNFIYQFFGFSRSDGFSHTNAYAVGFLIAMVVPKLVLIAIMFGEDVFRVPQGVYSYFMQGSEGEEGVKHFPSRRKFISQIALGLAAIPFTSILYGMYKGKYNFKVLKYVLHFEDLPDAFDGYKLTQISDIHSGSFDNIEKVKYAVDLINEQQSDVILFTGDIVNNKATELEPYVPVFNKLKAKDGMYSVLGNHDYGDYVRWNSDEEKARNLEDLKSLQKDIGFDVLLNENRFIEKDGQRIAIVGVENWGKGGFKKAGDLQKAKSAVSKDDFKVLLSHDPSHWDAEVVNDDYHYHLTLSGHTHGMQFGIEIPGWFKWSPVKWRYKRWAGIYEELGQYINVNRGFGYLAFPGRVGIWPEITVIELKKGKKTQNV
ncbi:phosphoesterase [Winogradskyella sp. PC-19]|uniref:metallophosphoesterase n=1 Tax=unclassified Winogradskyella TaxID=2615021 RepID=UPI000B3D4374|nr:MULTISPECIES: metallophosphoesterase [unclassified Winogradskyella]ARV09480.1 phosphoesterase [Winogradskyella sp. PC-19]RZN78452.1 MAG: metallophosphoesterase [Winogradskyella sp.]